MPAGKKHGGITSSEKYGPATNVNKSCEDTTESISPLGAKEHDNNILGANARIEMNDMKASLRSTN